MRNFFIGYSYKICCLCLILTTLSEARNDSICRSGFASNYSYDAQFPVPSSCITSSRLVLPLSVDETITWTQAELDCTAHGGHLVSVSSKAENDLLLQCLSSNKGLNVIPQDYFIGASYSNAVWSDGSAFAYNNSCEGEVNAVCPADLNVLNGQCAVLYAGSWASLPGILGCQLGGWYMAPESTVGYICSFPRVCCIPCTPGTYASGNTSSCTICPSWKFSSSMEQSSCSLCEAGTYLADSSHPCQVCTAGKYSTSIGAISSAACIDCPYGTYSTANGTRECSDCEYGAFSSSRGLTACSACSAGKFLN